MWQLFVNGVLLTESQNITWFAELIEKLLECNKIDKVLIVPKDDC